MRGKTCSKNSFIVEMHESGYKSLDVTKYKDCHHTLKKIARCKENLVRIEAFITIQPSLLKYIIPRENKYEYQKRHDKYSTRIIDIY